MQYRLKSNLKNVGTNFCVVGYVIADKKQTKEARQKKTSPAYDTGLCTLQEPCPNRRSFIIVAFATLFLLMGSTILTPLYGIYRINFALSHVSITLIYAMYALLIVPALFFFGPRGDMLSRMRLLIIAITFASFGTVILALASGLEWLPIGRLVQGIAIAAALGNATAALVEMEPTGDKQRASQVAGIAAISGLGLGPLVASLMAEYLFYPIFWFTLLNWLSSSWFLFLFSPSRILVPIQDIFVSIDLFFLLQNGHSFLHHYPLL